VVQRVKEKSELVELSHRKGGEHTQKKKARPYEKVENGGEKEHFVNRGTGKFTYLYFFKKGEIRPNVRVKERIAKTIK